MRLYSFRYGMRKSLFFSLMYIPTFNGMCQHLIDYLYFVTGLHNKNRFQRIFKKKNN